MTDRELLEVVWLPRKQQWLMRRRGGSWVPFIGVIPMGADATDGMLGDAARIHGYPGARLVRLEPSDKPPKENRA